MKYVFQTVVHQRMFTWVEEFHSNWSTRLMAFFNNFWNNESRGTIQFADCFSCHKKNKRHTPISVTARLCLLQVDNRPTIAWSNCDLFGFHYYILLLWLHNNSVLWWTIILSYKFSMYTLHALTFYSRANHFSKYNVDEFYLHNSINYIKELWPYLNLNCLINF